MAGRYETALAHYGLTNDQYRRAVAAHELAHGLIAAAMPTLDVGQVVITTHRQLGVHGCAYVGTAPGRQRDPIEKAAELYAGAIAKARWLRTVERRWSSDLEHLVRECAAGDRAIIQQLRLDRRQDSLAQTEAERAVTRQWPAITKAVPRLAKRGQISGRELRRLAR